MTSRVGLPTSLTGGATLSRSGEGVTFANQASSIQNPQPISAASPLATKNIVTTQMTAQEAAPISKLSPSIMSPSSVMPGSPRSFGPTPKAEKKEWGYMFNPLNLIWLILIFIIVWIILFTTQPNLVTCLKDGERVVDNGRLVLWTVVISIVIAVLLFVAVSLFKSTRR
jgi:hypothetical protein